MTTALPKSLQSLINQFAKLPGIGPKSAYRMAFYILKQEKIENERFAQSLASIKDSVNYCKLCNNLTEDEFCLICNDEQRDSKTILVVEDVLDLLAFENTRQYFGKYHIIGGLISPMKGVGPEDLLIKGLIKRIKELEVNEIIIATSPNLEGEATAMYMKNDLVQSFPHLKVTRIARGVPTGADLDYTDQVTLSRSLEGRLPI